jgi:hypothetical protein
MQIHFLAERPRRAASARQRAVVEANGRMPFIAFMRKNGLWKDGIRKGVPAPGHRACRQFQCDQREAASSGARWNSATGKETAREVLGS